MDPEQKRRIIAEACGHKNIHWQNGQMLSKWGAIKYYDPVPEYPNNSDAMRSAVLEQPHDFQKKFHDKLRKLSTFPHQTSMERADIFVDILQNQTSSSVTNSQ